MANAEYAKQWFLERGEENDVAKHFVAVSTNTEKVIEFGIDPMNMFVFWNWVGGRFSVWSTIGLSLCIAIGYEQFEQFLNGANWMDNHFRKEPTHKNIPKLMAGIGMFYSNFFNAKTQAILPYSQNMNLFPAFLQQADMESNGKTVDLDGKQVNYSTGPVVWGKAGTNGQHAFYQLIHQGTQIVPTDFIGFCKSLSPLKGHHDKLMANFFAQPEALMNGKDESQVRAELESQGLSNQELNQLLPYKVFKGNKPSNSFLFIEFNPYTLVALIAAYEHKIFVQGIIWNINSFDQWGVELGKQLAGKILPELNSKESISSHDQSTNALINYYNNY
jgi:glucose-6-phosphate isomerase